MKTVVELILLAGIAAASTVDLPDNFKKCRRSIPQFEECLAQSVQDAVVQLAPGLRSMKIMPIEPLAVESVSIGASQGTVALRQEYKNIKLHGLTKGLKLTNYKMDWKKKILSSDGYNPQVDFVANYKISGKVLLLPITGAGKSNITMLDLKTKNTVYFDEFKKNGETYWKAKKYDIRFNPSHVILQFDNLFNGDNILGEQMNRFINENSELLFKELQGPYEEAFGIVFTKITNEIFSRVPLNKIFPD